MTDLELRVRRILSIYRQRYRVVSEPRYDDEAVAAFLLAVEVASKKKIADAVALLRAARFTVTEPAVEQVVSKPERQTAPGAGDGKPGTPPRRTGPRAAKRGTA